MNIKTDRKSLQGDSEDKINQIYAYVENLRDEIEFRLNTLSQKIEIIYEKSRKNKEDDNEGN